MKREKLTTIWSLGRRAEVQVRIHYRITGRILTLERIEDLGRRARGYHDSKSLYLGIYPLDLRRCRL